MNTLVYFLYRRRTAFLGLTPLALLLLARPAPRLFWTGLPLVIAGSAIRFWSAGYIRKLDSLITAGPFAMCRNPLYVGSFLIALGYITMCGRLELWIAGPVLFWAFHGGAIVYEEGLLRERYGDAFKAYCARVPRLVPRFRRGGEGKFSIKQAFANDEPRSMAATFGFVAVFALVSYMNDLAPARLLFE
jgi:uncharacterized membrane protein